MNQNTFCSKCHRIPSQCGCNTAPRELDDDLIEDIALNYLGDDDELDFIGFARAILKKASEK